jgi:hypothetical protein
MLDPKFKYRVMIPASAHWTETEPWLMVHVGEWNERWYRIHDDMAAMVVGAGEDIQREYWFTDERDAFIFKLKWS